MRVRPSLLQLAVSVLSELRRIKLQIDMEDALSRDDYEHDYCDLFKLATEAYDIRASAIPARPSRGLAVQPGTRMPRAVPMCASVPPMHPSESNGTICLPVELDGSLQKRSCPSTC